MRSIKNVYKAFLQLIESQDDENQVGFISPQHMLTSTPASEAYSSETGLYQTVYYSYVFIRMENKSVVVTDFVDSEQHYTDDLRAGAFQFMDATNTLERDQLPLPYQCVFWESSPPAIAWRYPQPRSLTNVHIFPVPFQVRLIFDFVICFIIMIVFLNKFMYCLELSRCRSRQRRCTCSCLLPSVLV